MKLEQCKDKYFSIICKIFHCFFYFFLDITIFVSLMYLKSNRTQI